MVASKGLISIARSTANSAAVAPVVAGQWLLLKARTSDRSALYPFTQASSRKMRQRRQGIVINPAVAAHGGSRSEMGTTTNTFGVSPRWRVSSRCWNKPSKFLSAYFMAFLITLNPGGVHRRTVLRSPISVISVAAIKLRVILDLARVMIVARRPSKRGGSS